MVAMSQQNLSSMAWQDNSLAQYKIVTVLLCGVTVDHLHVNKDIAIITIDL